MLINSIMLAISSSLDSLGIGITYGLKNTKLSFISKIILFTISIIVTTFSIFLGGLMKTILSDTIAKIIGSIILIGLGLFIIIQSRSKNSSFDFNNSNVIDPIEAITLGVALSLDSLCIGIGSSISGLNSSLFPILVAILQLIFLNFGNFLGRKLIKIGSIPSSIWSIISGALLIIIGFLKIKC